MPQDRVPIDLFIDQFCATIAAISRAQRLLSRTIRVPRCPSVCRAACTGGISYRRRAATPPIPPKIAPYTTGCRRTKPAPKGTKNSARPRSSGVLRNTSAQTGTCQWCPGPDSNRQAVRRRIFITLHLSMPATCTALTSPFVRWTMPSPLRSAHQFSACRAALGAPRLVSTPSTARVTETHAGLGSALPRPPHTR